MTTIALIGASRRAQGGLPLPHRRRPVHRRRRRCRSQTLRRVPALAARARDASSSIDIDKAKKAPGVRRHLHRRGPRRRQGRRPALRLADHRRRRQADEGAAASGARAGQGALRRRPRRAWSSPRRSTQAQGRGRAGRGRLRGAARGGRRGDARKPGAPRCTTTRRTTPATTGRSATRPRSTRRSPRRAHVTKLEFVNNRLIPNAIEPRAANAHATAAPTTSYTLYVANQNPHVERLLMTAFVLGLPEHKVRVIAPDVGGGFGSKIYLYAERRALVPGRRSSVNRADQVDRRAQRGVPLRRARPRPRHHAELALDKDGKFLALRVQHDRQPGRLPVDVRVVHPDHPLRDAARRPVHDAGDLLRGDGGVHQHRAGRRLPRRRPARGDLRGRAAGRDRGARDEASTRPRSAGATSSRSFPYQTPVGAAATTPATTTRRSTRRCELADVGGLRGAQGRVAAKGQAARPRLRVLHRGLRHRAVEHRRRARRARRPVRGGRGPRASDRHASRCSPARTATARATRRRSRRSWPTRLGIPIENVDDRARRHRPQCLFGMGTYGSRSLAVGGTAIVKALDKIDRQGQEDRRAPAGGGRGRHRVRATASSRSPAPTSKMPFGEVALDRLRAAQLSARQARAGPERERVLRSDQLHLPGRHATSARSRSTATPAWSQIDRFTAVDDFGNIINPMIVEGQVHGGLAQGIGQALLEGCVYDDDSGQLLTGSYHGLRDAARRRRADRSRSTRACTPCTHNPLGVKGCGEAGAIGAPPAVMNAIDRCASASRTSTCPPRRRRVWRAIQQPSTPEENTPCTHSNTTVRPARKDAARARGQQRRRPLPRRRPEPGAAMKLRLSHRRATWSTSARIAELKGIKADGNAVDDRRDDAPRRGRRVRRGEEGDSRARRARRQASATARCATWAPSAARSPTTIRRPTIPAAVLGARRDDHTPTSARSPPTSSSRACSRRRSSPAS